MCFLKQVNQKLYYINYYKAAVNFYHTPRWSVFVLLRLYWNKKRMKTPIEHNNRYNFIGIKICDKNFYNLF